MHQCPSFLQTSMAKYSREALNALRGNVKLREQWPPGYLTRRFKPGLLEENATLEIL